MRWFLIIIRSQDRLDPVLLFSSLHLRYQVLQWSRFFRADGLRKYTRQVFWSRESCASGGQRKIFLKVVKNCSWGEDYTKMADFRFCKNFVLDVVTKSSTQFAKSLLETHFLASVLKKLLSLVEKIYKIPGIRTCPGCQLWLSRTVYEQMQGAFCWRVNALAGPCQFRWSPFPQASEWNWSVLSF